MPQEPLPRPRRAIRNSFTIKRDSQRPRIREGVCVDSVHFPTFTSTRNNGGAPGLSSFFTVSIACMGSGFIQ